MTEAGRRARGQLRRYCAANRINQLGTLTYRSEGCHDPAVVRGRYTLYWKGQIPPEVTKILDASELPGSIVPTEVSLPDLMRANRAAQKALAALGLPKAVRMASIMKNDDWSGVIAAVHDPDHLVSSDILSRLPSRVGPATVEWVNSDGVDSGYEISGQ
ncbi:MAG: hypothetical protein JWQ12_1163 [Glaciihabitans sp.]|nr:hypothetical protein [Glaciihabitans sp.]